MFCLEEKKKKIGLETLYLRDRHHISLLIISEFEGNN